VTEPSVTGPCSLTEIRVRELLNEIIDPCSAARGVPIGLADMGLIRRITVTGSDVVARLRVTGPGCMMFLDFERQARELLAEHSAGTVIIEWDPTPDWTPQDIEPSARQRLAGRRNLLGLASRANA
jgi:metal-sulfur cluster biosynthetic enzyme